MIKTVTECVKTTIMYMTAAVPARFLILVSHLVLTIIVVLARDNNIVSCMRINYSEMEYASLDIQVIVATAMSFGLFFLEFAAFIWAFSVTQQWQNLFSVLCHCAGTITLAFYLFDQWCCSRYWYVFGFCCIPPALTELHVWICNCVIKKNF